MKHLNKQDHKYPGGYAGGEARVHYIMGVILGKIKQIIYMRSMVIYGVHIACFYVKPQLHLHIRSGTVIYNAIFVINLDSSWKSQTSTLRNSWWAAAIFFNSSSTIEGLRKYQTCIISSCDWKLSKSTVFESWLTVVPSYCYLAMVLHKCDESWSILVPSFHRVEMIDSNESDVSPRRRAPLQCWQCGWGQALTDASRYVGWMRGSDLWRHQKDEGSCQHHQPVGMAAAARSICSALSAVSAHSACSAWCHLPRTQHLSFSKIAVAAAAAAAAVSPKPTSTPTFPRLRLSLQPSTPNPTQLHQRQLAHPWNWLTRVFRAWLT